MFGNVLCYDCLPSFLLLLEHKSDESPESSDGRGREAHYGGGPGRVEETMQNCLLPQQNERCEKGRGTKPSTQQSFASVAQAPGGE